MNKIGSSCSYNASKICVTILLRYLDPFYLDVLCRISFILFTVSLLSSFRFCSFWKLKKDNFLLCTNFYFYIQLFIYQMIYIYLKREKYFLYTINFSSHCCCMTTLNQLKQTSKNWTQDCNEYIVLGTLTAFLI